MKPLEAKVLQILNACGRSFKPGPVWRAAAKETANALDRSATADLRSAADARALGMLDVARDARRDAAANAELAAEIRMALAYFAS
jgi:hypothetical protein